MEGVGIRVEDRRFRLQGSEFRVHKIQGLEFRV